MFVATSAESRVSGPPPITAATYDATGPGATSGGANVTTAITSTHIATGGTDSIVIVGVAYTQTTGSTALPIVSYGGTAMTQLTNTLLAASNGAWLRFYYRLNPPSGAQTVSTTPPSSARICHASVSYVGVSSIGTPVIAARGTATTTKTVTVPSVISTDLVFSMHGSSGGSDFTAYNQTERTRVATTTSIVRVLMGDTGTAGAATGSINMTSTAGSSFANQAAIGVRLIH